MPRYFFHVRDGSEFSRDSEGQDLPDLGAARQEAVNAARELIGERLLHGGSIDGRAIEIADADDTVLSVVEAGDVLLDDGHFRAYRDDVTKSAPVANPIAMKSSRE